jgi:antitoxin (DNA-binding transcriptional repressor) of toxin-antitoxin stability system
MLRSYVFDFPSLEVARPVDCPLNDHMTRQMTATEVKAKLLALLDEVEKGEEIVITRRGKPIARLSAERGPLVLKDMFKGIARTADPKDNLYSMDADWDLP